MKYIIEVFLAIVSFGLSKLVFWVANPDDPEGTNLLVVAFLAAIIFAVFLLAYSLIAKKFRRTN